MCTYYRENGKQPTCTHDCEGCTWYKHKDGETYGHCGFCDRTGFGRKKMGNWFGKEVEYFICFDCDRETY